MNRKQKGVRWWAVAVAGVWLLAAVAPPARSADAKQVYEKNCASCHGPSGKGDGPVGKKLKPPPGDLSAATKKSTDTDLAKIVKEGGKAVGRAVTMPAFGKKLNDEEIGAVVQYIKTFGGR